MNQEYQITAKCHQKTGERCYRIKVSFPTMPMYINGFAAFSPNETYPDWYVKAPSFSSNKGLGKPVVEFSKLDGENDLWVAISNACIQAAKEWEAWQKRLENEQPMYK